MAGRKQFRHQLNRRRALLPPPIFFTASCTHDAGFTHTSFSPVHRFSTRFFHQERGAALVTALIFNPATFPACVLSLRPHDRDLPCKTSQNADLPPSLDDLLRGTPPPSARRYPARRARSCKPLRNVDLPPSLDDLYDRAERLVLRLHGVLTAADFVRRLPLRPRDSVRRRRAAAPAPARRRHPRRPASSGPCGSQSLPAPHQPPVPHPLRHRSPSRRRSPPTVADPGTGAAGQLPRDRSLLCIGG